jgi:putative transposase
VELMSNEQTTNDETLKRWTAKRRVALVLEILRGETTAPEAARRHGLTVAEIEQWKERFLGGAENALRSRPLDDEVLKDQEIKRLQRKVGELVMDIDILKEASKPNPSMRLSSRRVKNAMPQASLRRICRVLKVTRSTLYTSENVTQAETSAHSQQEQAADTTASPKPACDEVLIARIKALIEEFPTYGYRRICALLRKRDKLTINRKKVYRLMREQHCLMTQRQTSPKPRVQKKRSRSTHANERWAMDITHIPCGADGWGHLVAVIDCHDREIVGWEFALRGRAQEAERALEMACLARFGTLRPTGKTPVLRSDNGLVFLSRSFREACTFYRLTQSSITPYTPEQNGLIERFFRSFKEECVWQQNFTSFEEARRAVKAWLEWYKSERPHQALGELSPDEYRTKEGPPSDLPSQSLRAAQLGSGTDELWRVQARGGAATGTHR